MRKRKPGNAVTNTTGNPAEQKGAKKWWNTLPGILSALAGILTALTGLIAALHQSGLFSSFSNFHPGESPSKTQPQAEVTPNENESVNLWVVGNPINDDLPSTDLPPPLIESAKRLNIQITAKAIPAVSFSQAFSDAFDHDHPPDILCGHDGLLSFIKSRKEIESLVKVVKSLQAFGPGRQFLIATSPNHLKAKALIMNMLTAPPGAEANINNLKQADLERVRSTALSYAHALIACDQEWMMRVADKEAFGIAFTTNREPLCVGTTKVCGISGNNNLVFVSVLASIACKKEVGQMTLFEVMRNQGGAWKVLVASQNWCSIQLLNGPVQSLSNFLVESRDAGKQPPRPATLITPDGEYPKPDSGQRFGDFVWLSSASEDVVAELIEFRYEYSSRLTLNFQASDATLFLARGTSKEQRRLSTGRLGGGDLSWRVWSISKDGLLAASEYHTCRN